MLSDTFCKQIILVAVCNPRQSIILWITVLMHFYLISTFFLLRQKLQLLINNNTFLPSCFFKSHLTKKWPNDSDFLKNWMNRIISLKENSHHKGSSNIAWFILSLTYCIMTAYSAVLQTYRNCKHWDSRWWTVQNVNRL